MGLDTDGDPLGEDVGKNEGTLVLGDIDSTGDIVGDLVQGV